MPFGAFDDVLPDASWQQLVADDAVDHSVDITPPQSIDRKRRNMWLSDAGRIEIRPERHHQQHAKLRDPVHQSTEHLQGRGIDPMGVLENHQHRIVAR
jgi:hypothetical protein